jgi:hypothetical protein
MEKQFIVSIIEEDLDDQFKEDLEGHVRAAIGEAFGFDADVSFNVIELK